MQKKKEKKTECPVLSVCVFVCVHVSYCQYIFIDIDAH